jgi:hypothetical protein
MYFDELLSFSRTENPCLCKWSGERVLFSRFSEWFKVKLGD